MKAKKEDSISIKILVERNDGSTKSVSYDGKVEGFDKVIEGIKEIAEC